MMYRMMILVRSIIITGECTSEGEQGSLNGSSSEESECSVDEDENRKGEDSSKAHLRRSKRKKCKAEGECSHLVEDMSIRKMRKGVDTHVQEKMH
jgi:hypothetical protein